MTFISLADGCRRLGIDAKTLRRWLAEAQFPLQRHPCDGRKKGLCHEHLRQLATLHHRSLEALPQIERATPVPREAAALPAELLGLSETLGALHAQLAALQQQMADLTHLLQQPMIPASGVSAAPAAKRPPQPAPRSPRAASAATKPARKATHVLPLVEWSSDGHYVVICPKQGLLALEPDSPSWFAWLTTRSSFRFVGRHGRFTAHHEVERVPNGAWRAHRQIRNQSYNRRLGPTQDLTIAVLEQAAATLQAHLK
jgi:hypothetical protein